MFVCVATGVFAQGAKQSKPVVMILGTYHMSNPGRDLSNVKADDVRLEKRQREIADFLDILRKFQPTRIALEIPPNRIGYLDHYQEYIDGKYELAANEVDQIGFRLARALNHKRVYTIDWQGNFDFDKVLASAKANHQEAAANVMLDFGKTETAKFNEMMNAATITELLRYLNDDRTAEAMHKPYMAQIRIGAGDDYAGADLARDWYERNLKIYANIARLAESPNERILVLIGAGHSKLLRQFITEAGDFELEKLSQYL